MNVIKSVIARVFAFLGLTQSVNVDTEYFDVVVSPNGDWKVEIGPELVDAGTASSVDVGVINAKAAVAKKRADIEAAAAIDNATVRFSEPV